MQRDVAVVQDFLTRARRRVAILAAAHGVAVGLAAALVVALAGWPRRESLSVLLLVGTLAAIVGLLISLLVTAERRRNVAFIIERRAPESRNLIVTASELAPTATDTYVFRLVFGEAARVARRLDPAALFPSRNALLAALAALIAWLAVIARPFLPLPSPLRGSEAPLDRDAVPTIERVDVTIVPPAYTRRATQTLRDPARIEALAGSVISIAVHARASRVDVETLSSHDTLAGSGTFATRFAADADGYVAIQPMANGQTGARRLIGLTVLPDLPPRVRIITPGRDLRYPDGRFTLGVAIEASDDIGLATLALRFTKVSGSGERFTFVEGQVPITVSRANDRSWTARTTWKLDSLALGPGDMVVYRAVAADQRGSAGTTESDAYIAEVLAPGGVAAPGFAVDPEQERYAVSQQMVIIKTERLIARRATLSPEAFADESQQLAAEQRKVRAEFVFMLGGELADAPELAESMTEINEEEETKREEDILAGREANAGHAALLRGIRAMSRAAALLTTTDPTAALRHERTALTQLERAFSHSRILLRALSTRERLDLSRRLTGSLGDAIGDVRPTPEPQAGSATVELRRVLSELAALAASPDIGPGGRARATALAERLLRVDPSSRPLQAASAQLAVAAEAMRSSRLGEARASLDSASSGVVSILRRGMLDAPSRVPTIGEARMRGALTDALRGSRPR